MNRILVALFCIVGGLICFWIYLIAHPLVRAPERPSTVPSDAYWMGGVDGGNFYVCRLLLSRQGVYCDIYNDQSGTTQWSGTIPLKEWEQKKYSRIDLFYQDIDGYDGINFYLLSRESKKINSID
jgi:hypothetical protein